MSRRLRTCAVAVTLSVLGCLPDSPGEVSDRLGEQAAPVPGSASQSSGGTSGQTDSRLTVSVTGFGQIRVGQSLAEVVAALPGAIDTSGPLDTCDYISPRGWPEGVSAMLVEGHVVRIDVRSGTTSTLEGARIGSTESDVQALYPGQVSVLPHKYTAGHYLTVTPPGASWAEYRIVFETDGERVERYRAGILPEVEWVEGCG